MKKENIQLNENSQKIDLIEMAQKIWSERKSLAKSCSIAAILGIIIGFSIPKEYTTTITLAPEIPSGGKSMNNISALAGFASINLGGNQNGDALSPELYPDILSSTAFTTELFNIKIKDSKGKLDTTIYEYLTNHQKYPWWEYLFKLPFTIMNLVSPSNEVNTGTKVNAFHLTKEQNKIVKKLTQDIKISIDKKTSIISLSVTMQDPLIAATITDSVMVKLQNYITNYRTNKARIDLAYAEKIHNEAKQKYYKAQQEYAQYIDRNQNIRLKSVEAIQERLQNEMNLEYNLYNQTAQQLQLARAKVQENTPAFTVIQSATVPLIPSKPSKKIILAGLIFLTFAFQSGWILLGKDLTYDSHKKNNEQ